MLKSAKPHYAYPVAEREQILAYMKKKGGPQSMSELVKAMKVKGPEEKEGFERRLFAMVRDGQLLRNRRGSFVLVNAKDLIKGRVAGHPDGFGFLERDDGDSLTLSSRQMRQVMHGDTAVARVAGIDHRGRQIGEIVKVLERANSEVTGRYFAEGGVSFVIPENRKISQQIMVVNAKKTNVKNGHIVAVKINEHPTQHRYAIGEIVDVLGEYGQAGMEIEIAARVFGIPVDWPDELLAAIKTMDPTVREEDKVGREDLRDIPLLTIDGADAKDFDDAVYCKKTAGGWRLWVAIADVSHYVTPGSLLDDEALKRGTSVYFPDSVVPMLPEILSNELCSLKSGKDRLCMVCDMTIDESGQTRRARFYRGVMNSVARLTYDQVWAEIDATSAALTGDDVPPAPKSVRPVIAELHALYKTLHQARHDRGSIDFDTVETKIVFDDDRKIKKIVPQVRNDAHRMIEECMIAANVSAAKFLARHKIPTLYRSHPEPKETRVENLHAFLGQLGLTLGSHDEIHSRDYARLLEQIRTRPDFQLIQAVMLRSLSQADYRPENVGHFGLSLDTYCHFTSPIRRYPDLMVHRAIGHLIDHRKRAGFAFTSEQMAALGSHCSMAERRADEASWDAMRALKCRFMLDYVGSEFTGVISGINSFGMFVELDGIYIEGLVHVTELGDDFYQFDPVSHRFTGQRTGEKFRLADAIKVRVVRVDLDEKKIDLVRVIDAAAKRRAKKNQAATPVVDKKKKHSKKMYGKGAAKDRTSQKPTRQFKADASNKSTHKTPRRPAGKPKGSGRSGKYSSRGKI